VPTSSRSAKAKAEGFAGFAGFLRRYLSAWPILAACLIGPIAKYLRLLPVYKDHENMFAATTSLYGLVIAAALFFYRPVARRLRASRSIAQAWAPLALIVISAGCLFLYLYLIQESIREKRETIAGFVPQEQTQSREILARTDLTNIPKGDALFVSYLGMFFAAETALVLMALREYAATEAPTKKRAAKQKS
jgi:hypothetical protein